MLRSKGKIKQKKLWRKEHKDAYRDKAMICTAAVLIAMGIFKELAAVCLITAVVFEEGVKKFDR